MFPFRPLYGIKDLGILQSLASNCFIPLFLPCLFPLIITVVFTQWPNKLEVLFPLSNISTTAPFSLLHCDIWGPHRISSHSGARYFLTIVDDFTRCTWVFLMSNKSDTQSLLKSFFLFVCTQFNVNIKTIRTDNGSEFLSTKEFFLVMGLSFNVHVCTHHNKMTLLNASIATFSMSHVLCASNLIYPYLFWGSVF